MYLFVQHILDIINKERNIIYSTLHINIILHTYNIKGPIVMPCAMSEKTSAWAYKRKLKTYTNACFTHYRTKHYCCGLQHARRNNTCVTQNIPYIRVLYIIASSERGNIPIQGNQYYLKGFYISSDVCPRFSFISLHQINSL